MGKKTTKWYKLDRTADIYPMSSTRTFQSNFRIGTELKESVDEEVLAIAINKALERFPSFRVQLRRGFFRYYLEKNNANPKVFKDDGVDFQPIDYLRNNRFLFKTKVYKNNIVLDFFHGLSDAVGAIEFLKTILYVYYQELGEDAGEPLNVKHLEEDVDPQEYADDVLKYYKKFKTTDDVVKTMIGKNCFGIKGKKLIAPGYSIVQGIVNSQEFLNLARSKDLSVTALLGGILLLSIHNTFENPKNKDLVAMIPVNLRGIFPSKTVHNFTTLVRCKIDPQKTPATIEDYSKEVSRQIKEGVSNKDLLQAKLSLSALLSKNPIAKVLPAFLKTLFVKLPKIFSVGTKQTIILSNIGVVKTPEILAKKVQKITANLNVSNKVPINCGVVTHANQMSINFTRKLQSPKLELAFFDILKKEGLTPTIYANDRVEYLMEKASKKRNYKNIQRTHSRVYKQRAL